MLLFHLDLFQGIIPFLIGILNRVPKVYIPRSQVKPCSVSDSLAGALWESSCFRPDGD